MHQSAYRKDHSAETAVLSVLDCLLVKADERLVSLIAPLDLSAAFDTLDHSILLKRLEVTFAVLDAALEWFASSLSDRCLSVIVDSIVSAPSPLVYGVPQGSVLELVLLTVATFTSMLMILSFYKVHHLMNSALCRQAFRHVLMTSLSWMNSNKLMLNTDKQR